MITYTLCFCGELEKIIPELSPDTCTPPEVVVCLYSECPKISNTYSIPFLPYFCFLCICFLTLVLLNPDIP